MQYQERDFIGKLTSKIRVVDKLPVCDPDNDPVLRRKEEEAYKALTEVPLPDFLLKRAGVPEKH